MKDIYECSVCGVVSRAPGQVCEPSPHQSRHDYCGTTEERSEMCDSVKEHLAFVCGTCGRPAEQRELVCNPLSTAEG